MNIKLSCAQKAHCNTKNGGIYHRGKSFSTTKWIWVIETYRYIVRNEGKCSCKRLASECLIGETSAKKAMRFEKKGGIEIQKRGTKVKGIGSLKQFKKVHHDFIYDAYRENPSQPAEMYQDLFEKKFGFSVSQSFISRWFQDIGPYKGSLRETSLFPSKKNSPTVRKQVKRFLRDMERLKDHTRLVFADEKPMKERELMRRYVRRDPITGLVPQVPCDAANNKIRWNIFAAITVKMDVENNVEFIITDENGDAFLFQNFVMHLLEKGILRRGDIFVVDNCSIHMKGENNMLVDILWEDFGILMLPLPPYHCELNPTEFIFHHLVKQMQYDYIRQNSNNDIDFVTRVENSLLEIQFDDVWKNYRHCGYLRNMDV